MDSIISSDSILKIDNLTMQFGGLKAVDQLTFEVKKGEIFGLIGPNGAGKTTVFNCITQFYKSTQGKVLYRDPNGRVLNLNSYKVHDVIQTGIVRTFQNVELIWELSILDNMLVGAHSLYRSRFIHHSFQTFSYKREESILRARAEKILTDLDLIAYKHFYPIGLPYGVLKRIELARTLMTNPSLIILDEPAAGLNDAETEELAHTIKKIQSDYHCTIFLVEHDMGLVMSICDTICAISFGRKLAMGTASEIQKSPVVQEAYLGGE
ncbi:MAG: ABC transporter ATP-binding protein [Tenericutes bacterium HGW-Tenericutes-2]|nr:MAG: ABC transporter ATP-binding protein [Tenericutes bacterium HGW-Tenericutes-2]